MNTKRRLSKTVLATGLFMSNIWCTQAVKSKAGISRINFTPLTHPLPLPICSHKTGPECATGNQAKTIQEKHILILATQLPLGSLNTLPSKCFHTPSHPSALDRLSLNCKLIPQLISVWHCFSTQPRLVKCPVGQTGSLSKCPLAASVMWRATVSAFFGQEQVFGRGLKTTSFPLINSLCTLIHGTRNQKYLLKSCLRVTPCPSIMWRVTYSPCARLRVASLSGKLSGEFQDYREKNGKSKSPGTYSVILHLGLFFRFGFWRWNINHLWIPEVFYCHHVENFLLKWKTVFPGWISFFLPLANWDI